MNTGLIWAPRALLDPGDREAGVATDVLVRFEHGTISEVSTGTRPPATARRFSEGLLIPGLVNAHTHLELAGFDAVCTPGPFHEWLAGLVELVPQLTGPERAALALHGAHECAAAGMTTLVDCSWSGAAVEAMVTVGLSGRVLLEVFAPELSDRTVTLRQPEMGRLEEQLRAAGVERELALGWSPHAPYTCDADSIAMISAGSRPWSMHMAESPAEVALFADRAGPLASPQRLAALRLSETADSPMDVVRGTLTRAASLVHGVHLTAEELSELSAAGAALVLCPRSNRTLECGDAPLAAILAAGTPCAIGTDSPASAGPFDLFAELRALAAVAGRAEVFVPREWLLSRAGAGGAEAIGFTDRGRIEPGMRADITVLAGATGDPAAWLIGAAQPGDVRATIAGGRTIWDAGDRALVDARGAAARAAGQVVGRLRAGVATRGSGV